MHFNERLDGCIEGLMKHWTIENQRKMNILFLTMLSSLRDVEAKGIYSDLMRKFRDEGHEVYIIYPNERRSLKA